MSGTRSKLYNNENAAKVAARARSGAECKTSRGSAAEPGAPRIDRPPARTSGTTLSEPAVSKRVPACLRPMTCRSPESNLHGCAVQNLCAMTIGPADRAVAVPRLIGRRGLPTTAQPIAFCPSRGAQRRARRPLSAEAQPRCSDPRQGGGGTWAQFAAGGEGRSSMRKP